MQITTSNIGLTVDDSLMRVYVAAGFLPTAAHAAMHLVRAGQETAR